MPYPLLPTCVAFTLTTVACLDATPGRVGEDPGGPDAPDCARSAPLERIADDVGDFALGPCGDLAYWDTSGPRALELVDRDHRHVGTLVDENAYGGDVTFSPSGRRVLATSLRSDLGFGDVVIGAFPSRAPFVVDSRFGLPDGHGAYLFDAAERVFVVAPPGISGSDDYRVGSEGGAAVAPDTFEAFESPLALPADDHILYVAMRAEPAEDGTDADLVALAIADGSRRTLGGMRRAWLEGSTQRSRDSAMVTWDGSRALIVAESVPYGDGPPAVAVRAVVDVASGAALVTDLVHWHAPRVGPGPLVAADDEDGVVVVDASGAVVHVPGHTLHTVMADHVLTTASGSLYAFTPAVEAAPRLVVAAPLRVVSTPSGRHAAVVFGSDEDRRLALWREGGVVRIDEPILGVALASDDGVTLARTPGGVVLFDGRGQVLRRWTGSVESGLRRGDFIFFERGKAPNDVLHRVDVVSGEDSSIAEGHDFRFQVDPSGTVVAFSYLPLSATVRELHAGRL